MAIDPGLGYSTEAAGQHTQSEARNSMGSVTERCGEKGRRWVRKTERHSLWKKENPKLNPVNKSWLRISSLLQHLSSFNRWDRAATAEKQNFYTYVGVCVCVRLCVCTLVPFERDLSVNKMTGSLFFSTSFGLVQLCGSRVNELCWVELASPWQVGVPAEMPCIISACLLWSSQAHCWFIDNLHKGTWFRAVVHPVTHRGQCGTASPCHSILFFFL